MRAPSPSASLSTSAFLGQRCKGRLPRRSANSYAWRVPQTPPLRVGSFALVARTLTFLRYNLSLPPQRGTFSKGLHHHAHLRIHLRFLQRTLRKNRHQQAAGNLLPQMFQQKGHHSALRLCHGWLQHSFERLRERQRWQLLWWRLRLPLTQTGALPLDADYLAFLPQFIHPARGHAMLWILQLGVLFALMGWLSDSAWALLAASWKRSPPPRTTQCFRGGALIALGLASAFSDAKSK